MQRDYDLGTASLTSFLKNPRDIEGSRPNACNVRSPRRTESAVREQLAGARAPACPQPSDPFLRVDEANETARRRHGNLLVQFAKVCGEFLDGR
jgi:hypothetical protein